MVPFLATCEGRWRHRVWWPARQGRSAVLIVVGIGGRPSLWAILSLLEENRQGRLATLITAGIGSGSGAWWWAAIAEASGRCGALGTYGWREEKTALGTYEEECGQWIQKRLEKLIFTGVTNGGPHTCFLAFYRCKRGLSWIEPYYEGLVRCSASCALVVWKTLFLTIATVFSIAIATVFFC
jgi:hypothetical protein